jgi:hypothetical protein
MIRSTVLTLVNRRSTWAITSKTSSTNPNDPFWSTIVNLGQNPTQKPLDSFWPTSVNQYFCRVLRISPKHFKFSQYKSCVFCRGTQLSCWVAFEIWSGIVWKMQVNAYRHCSPKPSFRPCSTACAKVVVGQLIYNFAVDRLVHLCWRISSNRRSNSAKLNSKSTARPACYSRPAASACHRARRTRTSRQACARWVERRVLVPVPDVCRSPGRCHVLFAHRPRRAAHAPSLADGRLHVAAPFAVPRPCRDPHRDWSQRGAQVTTSTASSRP